MRTVESPIIKTRLADILNQYLSEQTNIKEGEKISPGMHANIAAFKILVYIFFIIIVLLARSIKMN